MARQEINLPTVAPMARSAVGVNTFVQHYADPNAGRGLEQLAQALSGFGKVVANKQASASDEYKQNLDYYANQFAKDKDLGLVDATQVGTAYPDASPIVAGQITQLLGKQWGEDYVRQRMDEFLADDSLRLNPQARREFFASLRAEVGEQVQGRAFFGQGAISATEAVINEFESGFQRESAEHNQKVQEDGFQSSITPALLGEPVHLGREPEQGAGMVISSIDGKADPENFLATTPETQAATRHLSSIFGKPLRITPHGGKQADKRSTSSQHHHGNATDIYIADYSDAEKEELVALAIANGARGIGSYSAGDGKGTLHVDYRKGGKAFKDQVEGGLALWHRLRPGEDASWDTGPDWYKRGIKRGLKMLKEGKTSFAASNGSVPTGLLEFVADSEKTHGNYNAYYGNANNRSIKFTGMTVDQVLGWQRGFVADGSISSAVGKYQFLQGTLRGLKESLGLSGDEKFTPELQDKLAVELMRQRGLEQYLSGEMSQEEFANSLAQEWASLPLVSGPKAGKSYYEGDAAGNRALTTPENFLTALDNFSKPKSGVEAVDSIFGQTSSINPIRRRELTVQTAIDLALVNRDTAILDRIPAYMASVPDVAAKIEKAREQTRDLLWKDYSRTHELNKHEQEKFLTEKKQEILDKLVAKEEIDPAEYAQYGDDIYKFAMDVRDDELVDPVDSANLAGQVRDAFLQGSTSGFFGTTADGQEVTALTYRQAVNQIQSMEGLSAQDKIALIEEVPTLLEGMNLITNPKVNKFYGDRIGADVEDHMQSIEAIGDKLRGTNISGSVRRVFDSSLRMHVQAYIEEHNAIPRGLDFLNILEAAEAKAEAKLQSYISRQSTANTDNDPTTVGQSEFSEDQKALLEKYSN